MRKIHVAVLAGLGVSLLPIWRDPGSEKVMTLWQYLHLMATTERPHIPYEEAVRRAGEAYEANY